MPLDNSLNIREDSTNGNTFLSGLTFDLSILIALSNRNLQYVGSNYST